MTELVLKGDTELWVVNHVDGAWRIPVLADPYGPKDGQSCYYRLTEPFVLNAEQVDALEGRLKLFRESAGNEVVMTNENLARIATKAKGITPRHYLHWPGVADAVPVGSQSIDQIIDLSEDAKSFCEFVSSHTQVVPAKDMKLIWKAITSEAMVWMVDRKKTLDLGFTKLFAVPYRPNWKQILMAMCPAASIIMRNNKPKDIQEAMLIEVGFMSNLYNTILASIHRKSQFCYWDLECVPQDSWWQATAYSESNKLARLGAVKYAKYWVASIKRQAPRIVDAFSRWSWWNTVPCAEIGNSRLFGGQMLKPRTNPGRIRPVVPRQGAVFPVVPDNVAQLKGPEREEDLAGPDAQMRQVSNLQSQEGDMRISVLNQPGNSVGEPGNKDPGTDGMLLPDDIEIPSS